MNLFGVTVIGAAILGITWYFGHQRHERLRSEGKIIKRDIEFMEKAEIFTLDLGSPDQVTQGVQGFSYSEMKVSVNSDTSMQSFQFSNSYGWNARLYCTENNNGRATYRFEFLNWKTSNGAADGILYMNMLLTAVEKMFLSIDPHTQVQETLLSTTTRHKFF